MGVKDELNAMFDALEGKSKDEPLTDPPTTDEPPEVKTDPPETDPPAPETDEPKTDAPTTDAPVDDELDRIKRENEELRKKLADREANKVTAPKTDAPTTDAPIEVIDFLKDKNVDELADNPEEFNKLLNTIYKKAIETARAEDKRFADRALKTIPKTVEQNLTVKENLKRLSEKFYEDNSDLEPFKKVVSVVFEELAQDHPDKPYEEVLKLVGEETRNRLELPKRDPKRKPKGNDDPPPLPRKKGGRSTQPQPDNLDPTASEIDAMNKVLKR